MNEEQRAALEQRLDAHRRWAESGGTEGERLDAADIDVDWSGIVLAEADLRDALLGGIHDAGGDLYGALATGAIFDGASLTGANLAKSTLDEAHFVGADLRGASLLRASLSDAMLARADLRDADLRKAYLVRADLTGATLTGAKLAGATLAGAKLDDILVDWIDIGRDIPERLDSGAAHDWLATRARGG